MEKEDKQLIKKLPGQFASLLDFFRHNPGMALSIAYLLLTLSGIFYSISFYKAFGIDILKFSDISDFMIAGISEPPALLLFAGGLLVSLGFDRIGRVSYAIHQRWLDKPKSVKRRIILLCSYVPKDNINRLITFLLMFIIYAFVFVSFYAQWRSEAIKASETDFVVLKLTHMQEDIKVKLLGTTTNYVFTYDIIRQQSLIIPLNSICFIQPI
ncbi:hypothetical protein EXU34_20685 [Alteromonas sp. ZYF713]|nr:hypothetical protein [Alteromonas sp. ZYF713]